MSDSLKYEVLALDPGGQTRCEDALSLLHMLAGCSDLWKSKAIDEENLQIKDGETVLEVTHVQNPSGADQVQEASFERAFIVRLCGHYDKVEGLRQTIVSFLKDLKFATQYVLKDEISEHIAVELYPHLYRIENQLRGYLSKFMSTRFDVKWWEKTVPKEIRDKAKRRKKNEVVFGSSVENSAYLIDFSELGAIIYKQTSGFLTKEDILEQINSLPDQVDNLDAFNELKRNLQTNYDKLFKESFADKGFKEKWEKFEILRHKIAHGNLFTASDLMLGKELAEEIKDIIVTAEEKTEELVITAKEHEAIQESLASDTDYDWEIEIKEDEFLSQLESHEAYFLQDSGFVGLSLFKKHLTNLGYSFYSINALITQLDENKKIKIYSVKNPNSPYDTSAIRRTTGTR